MQVKIYHYHTVGKHRRNPRLAKSHTLLSMKNITKGDCLSNPDIVYNKKYKIYKIFNDKISKKQAEQAISNMKIREGKCITILI